MHYCELRTSDYHRPDTGPAIESVLVRFDQASAQVERLRAGYRKAMKRERSTCINVQRAAIDRESKATKAKARTAHRKAYRACEKAYAAQLAGEKAQWLVAKELLTAPHSQTEAQLRWQLAYRELPEASKACKAAKASELVQLRRAASEADKGMRQAMAAARMASAALRTAEAARPRTAAARIKAADARVTRTTAQLARFDRLGRGRRDENQVQLARRCERQAWVAAMAERKATEAARAPAGWCQVEA